MSKYTIILGCLMTVLMVLLGVGTIVGVILGADPWYLFLLVVIVFNIWSMRMSWGPAYGWFKDR